VGVISAMLKAIFAVLATAIADEGVDTGALMMDDQCVAGDVGGNGARADMMTGPVC